MNPELKRNFENQTAIMCALAVVMDFVKINVAELRVGAGLQRVRLTDAIAATRDMTEPDERFIKSAAAEVPGAQTFAASTEPALPCPGESGALREANANREHLRQTLRDTDTADVRRVQLEAVLIGEGYQPHEATRMASVLFGVAGAR